MRASCGEASNTNVGAILTVVLCDALPPTPEQESENVAASVSDSVSSEPDVAFVPVQPSEATQSVACLLDQVSVVISPEDTTSGAAERETVVTAWIGVAAGSDPPLPPQPEMVSNTNANIAK